MKLTVNVNGHFVMMEDDAALSRLNIITISSYPYAALTSNHYEAAGSGGTINLYASPVAGDQIEISDTISGSVTVDGNGNLILGAATYQMTQNETSTFYYEGSQWKFR